MSDNGLWMDLPGSLPPCRGQRMDLDPEELLLLTILVRPATTEGMASVEALSRTGPMARRSQPPEQHAILHGANPGDLVAVEAHARRHGAVSLRVTRGGRAVTLRGPAATLAAAFGSGADSVGGPLLVPAPLAPLIEAVLGIDRRRVVTTTAEPAPVFGAAEPRGALLALGLPPGLDGRGRHLAVVGCNGAVDCAVVEAAVAAAGGPTSSISIALLDPGATIAADAATTAAVAVAAAIAPAAAISVHLTDASERGLVDGLVAAVHDGVRRPDVILVPGSAAVTELSAQARHAVDGLLHAAAVVGTSVCAPGGQDCVPEPGPLVVSAAALPRLLPVALIAGPTGPQAMAGPALDAAAWAGLLACITAGLSHRCGAVGPLLESIAHADGLALDVLIDGLSARDRAPERPVGAVPQ